MTKTKSIIILFLFIFAYLTFFSIFRINDADEGYILTGSMRILAGEMPYKDFFTHTSPLSYYAQAGVFKVFGQKLIVARITTAFIGLLISILLYLISRRLMPAGIAVLSSILFMVWGTGHANYPSFAWFGLLFSLLALYLFVLFTEWPVRAWLITASGFMAGLAFLSKQNLGFCAIASFVLFLLMDSLLRAFLFKTKISYLQLVKNIFLISGAFILPILVTVYLFHLKGAGAQFLHYVFVVGAKSGIQRREMFPFPSVRPPSVALLGIYSAITYMALRFGRAQGSVRFFRSAAVIFITLVISGVILARAMPHEDKFLDYVTIGSIRGFFNFLVFGCLLSIVLFFLKIRKKPLALYERKKKALLIAVFALLYIWAGLFVSRDMLHHVFSFPPAFILTGYVFYQVRLMLRKTNLEAALNYAVIFPVTFMLVLGFAANINNETFKDSEPPLYKMNYPVRLERAGYILTDQDTGRDVTGLVDFLDKHTAPSEYIFHTYFYNSEIYFLANRMPASFFHFMHPDTMRIQFQSGVINDIIRNKVRYIFVDYRRFDDREALSDPSRNPTSTYDVEKYIYDNYKYITRFGRFIVLEKIA